jgi:hypothetical protein
MGARKDRRSSDSDYKMKNLDISSSIDGGGALGWTDYATQWDTPPVNLGSGVLQYTWLGVTRHRFVPDPYVAAQDAFYTDLAMTDLVAARGA